MLYIIGGAPRSGKTLLSRRVVSEKKIPYFPLDALVGALAHGASELGIRYEDPLIERSLKMWQITKFFLKFFLKEEKDFLIEGDSIPPSKMNDLLAEEKSIKCCFVGYTQLNRDEKLALVRKYHQGETDWTKNISDTEMLKMIDEMVEYSKYLEKECAQYNIKYFDVSHDFDRVHEEIFNYMFEK